MRKKKKIAIGLAVGLGVALGLAYGLGAIDLDKLRTRVPDREQMADLRTKAQIQEARLKAGLRSRGSESPGDEAAAARVCRQSLRNIESAKRTTAARSSQTTGALPLDAVMRELGGALPTCPKGGTYTVGTVEQLPRCSIGAAGTTDKEDDHILAVF